MSVLTLRDVPQEDARPSRPSPEERLHDLFEDHSGRVLAYALRRLGSEDAAKDIVSETFMVAWRKIDEVPADSLPWLLGVARRVLSHHYRSSRSQMALQTKLESAATYSPGPEVKAENDHELREIAMALRSLSESDQEILTLVDWEGFSNRKAALVLGVTPATFGVRLHRARRRLGVALGDGGHRPARAAMATKKTKEAG